MQSALNRKLQQTNIKQIKKIYELKEKPMQLVDLMINELQSLLGYTMNLIIYLLFCVSYLLKCSNIFTFNRNK